MAGSVRKHTLRVSEELSGTRLDQAVAALVDELSRRRARVLIDLGGVFVNGHRVKVASRRVAAGQEIEVHIGGAFERATKQVGTAARLRDESELPAPTILFEDEHLIVIDKPAGLLTAPTPESDRNNALSILESRGRGQIWVVHRLDLQTSGVMVFAASAVANKVLSETFREHDIDRRYLTAVEGTWPSALSRIEEPVEGKEARTDIELVEVLGPVTLLRAKLHTGRNHQIRRHVSGVGHPVAGDRRYGADTRTIRPPRVALHAAHLGIRHPASAAPLEFDAPLPADLAGWFERLRAEAGDDA